MNHSTTGCTTEHYRRAESVAEAGPRHIAESNRDGANGAYLYDAVAHRLAAKTRASRCGIYNGINPNAGVAQALSSGTRSPDECEGNSVHPRNLLSTSGSTPMAAVQRNDSGSDRGATKPRLKVH